MNGHETKTRAEHLAWCKQRAIELAESGDVNGAWLSMISDLNKHSATRDHSAIELGMRLLIGGHLSTPEQMKEFIEGFN